MLLSDVAMLNDSFIQHPPVDLLVASYLGFKSPETKESNAIDKREAVKLNTAAIKQFPLIRSGKVKTIDQMPGYVRSPAKLALIEKMKREMAG